nr:hypothetical protein [Tanacetum cinerariifolium]
PLPTPPSPHATDPPSPHPTVHATAATTAATTAAFPAAAAAVSGCGRQHGCHHRGAVRRKTTTMVAVRRRYSHHSRTLWCWACGVMSSPNHPTFNIEDGFSSNSPDYVLASPGHFLTSPGNTSSDSSVNPSGLIPIASPTLSLFHDGPYMKVMHAYYAKESPIPTPITSSNVLSPSPVLPLPLFNP